ncbi:MAG: type 4a pilus biogenesis protein PilO [Mariprofundus sp.]|nr:type 4a pilus biogenesis protein PilO [Mariprofundus sp.]
MFESMKQPMYESLRQLLPLPLYHKIAALIVIIIVIIGVYISLVWMPLQDEIAQQQAQLEVQKALLVKNKSLADNLPRKQKEYAELEKQLKVALNMLPKKSQIPDLLENVSWAGKDSGLGFTTFKPESEVIRQIYAEVPVSFKVSGTFRQLLTFLKRVGEMPRIVDVQQLQLTGGKNGGALIVEGKAVTYRFVEGKSKRNR